MKAHGVGVSYDTGPMEAITPAQYRTFQEAYDFFNVELFSAALPPVMVTLQRHANAKGYFAPVRFTGRVADAAAHELALNPDQFTGRTDDLILSTLVHEMAHVWQYSHGTPPRRSYHDRQWAAKMREIGLQPTHTGEPGGQETGQSITHYILAEGAYAKAYARLKAAGFRLHWESAPEGGQTQAKKKASKTKFTCPQCGQNAWAKPDAALICGECYYAASAIRTGKETSGRCSLGNPALLTSIDQHSGAKRRLPVLALTPVALRAPSVRAKTGSGSTA
jgi:ribosomal protein S27AE